LLTGSLAASFPSEIFHCPESALQGPIFPVLKSLSSSAGAPPFNTTVATNRLGTRSLPAVFVSKTTSSLLTLTSVPC